MTEQAEAEDAGVVPVGPVEGEGVVADAVDVDELLVGEAEVLRGRGVALGPFQPPADESEFSSFIAGLRERMVGELHKLREAA